MTIPGPQGIDQLRTLWNFQRNQFATLFDLVSRYGDLLTYRFGPFPVVFVNDAEAVHRVLVDNHPNYGKRHNPFYNMLRSFLGDGLLTSDGDFWLRQRRLAQPAFSRKKIAAFEPIIVSCTEEMIARWRTLPDGTVLDAVDEMMHLTLRIIGFVLFSQDLGQNRHAVGRALDEIQVQMGERFSSLIPLPPVLPTARDRRFRQAQHDLEQLAMTMIAERRCEKNPPEDLLTSLLQARDPETGEQMSDKQACDELITFLLAGHETTANTLAWTFYLLSLHPSTRRALEDELEAGPPRPLKSLCDRILLESMRLYPPAWVFGRRSLGADVLAGHSIAKHRLVTVSPYILHRNPRYWPNPEGFDPDRFLGDIPKGAYVPFAAGPRQCIGNNFALMEARLILSTLARHVRLNMVEGTRPDPEPLITLRPRHGLPVTLEFRSSPSDTSRQSDTA